MPAWSQIAGEPCPIETCPPQKPDHLSGGIHSEAGLAAKFPVIRKEHARDTRESRQKEAVVPGKPQLARDVEEHGSSGLDHIGNDQLASRLQQPVPELQQRDQLVLSDVLNDRNHQDQVDRTEVKPPQILFIQDNDPLFTGKPVAEALPDCRCCVEEVKSGASFREALGPQSFTATKIENDLPAPGRHDTLDIPCQALEMGIEIALIHVDRVRPVPEVDP